jgi:hypothetical protein
MMTYAASSIAVALAAFTAPSMAAGTPEQRRACTQDAFKYCSSEIPDVARITVCMVKNRGINPG